VVVTGASGFIGRHLLRRLATEDFEIHATTRGRPPSDLRKKAIWHVLDLDDAAAVDEFVAAQRPEIVFHLASHVEGSRDIALVLPTFHGNLTSTVHLLSALVRHGSCHRFVQAGSLEEPDFGEPNIPASPYAAAKAAASSYIRMFLKLYDLPVVLARIFMVYGPGKQDEAKLVPYVIRTLLCGGRPQLSSGVRSCDWIHVDDVVEGLYRLAIANGVVGRQVDLGLGEMHTVREIVEEIYRQVLPQQRPPFGTLADRPFEQLRKAKTDETLAVLGWVPTISVQEGLRRTVEYFRSVDTTREGDRRDRSGHTVSVPPKPSRRSRA
jgi:nucleoside-diphosphate-sugar epimerase